MKYRIHKIDVVPDAPGSWVLIKPNGHMASYHRTRDEARKAAGLKPARRDRHTEVARQVMDQRHDALAELSKK